MSALNVQAWALQGLPWSNRSPQEGDPECTCMLCGLVIGVADEDPRRDTHDEDCIGCEVCEIAIRIFKGNGKACREQRYHVRCFERILAPNPTLGPVHS